MIRRRAQKTLERLALAFPAVTVTGPRQSGKTTLCRASFPGHDFVSLEDPSNRAFAREDPLGFLASRGEALILDEIQHVPDLLSYLQPKMDADPAPGRYILTGSQNLSLSETTSQSLAGRTGLLQLLPFEAAELAATRWVSQTLFERLFTGGFPPLYDRPVLPADWLSAYAATYVERDVRTLLNVGDLGAFRTFLELAASRIGTAVNLSQLGADSGITHTTARQWLSVLESSFVAFRLRPWARNLGKRLVKTPKLYFYDTGLVCHLLGIDAPEQLRRHPLRGPIFENYVVIELVKHLLHSGTTPRVWYYGDRSTEVDLLVQHGGRYHAVEVKSGETVARDYFKQLETLTESWPEGDLPLESWVVYGGDRRETRTPGTVLPWGAAAEVLGPDPAPA